MVPEEMDKIKKLGIPYIVIRYTNMEEQIKALQLIGKVVGGESLKKNQEIVDFYKKTLKYVKDKTREIPERERVRVYHTINGVTRTDGIDSLGADWIKAVGCENISVGEKLLKEGEIYTTSKEQIFIWEPDVIICNEKRDADFFKSSPMFSSLNAVAEQKIYNIPVSATRWGQPGSMETYFAMLWLGKTVYPDYYMDLDLEETVCQFYSQVQGIHIDKETYDKILKGEGLRKPPKG